MNQRIITGILFTLGIALFVVPGYWWPAVTLILFAAVSFLARMELSRALLSRRLELPPVLSRIGSLLFLLPLLALVPGVASAANTVSPAGISVLTGMLIGQAFLLSGLVFWAIVTLLAVLMAKGPDALPSAVAAAGAYFYLVLPMGAGVLLLYFVPQGWLWLVVALASPWISDVFAFFAGSLLGKHKIVPKISPKKTVEGSIGGLLGGVVAVLILLPTITGLTVGSFFRSWPMLTFATITGITLSVASQFGDWLASGIKRWCEVKDYGHWLPGHGGILDRFDSVLFTLPMTLVLAAIFEMLLKGNL